MNPIFLKCEFVDTDGEKVWKCIPSQENTLSNGRTLNELEEINLLDVEPEKEVKKIKPQAFPLKGGSYKVVFLFKDNLTLQSFYSDNNYIEFGKTFHSYKDYEGSDYLYTQYISPENKNEIVELNMQRSESNKYKGIIKIFNTESNKYITNIEKKSIELKWCNNNTFFQIYENGVLNESMILKLDHLYDDSDTNKKLYNLSNNNSFIWTGRGMNFMQKVINDDSIVEEKKISDQEIMKMLNNNKLISIVKDSMNIPDNEELPDKLKENLIKSFLLDNHYLTTINDVWTQKGVDFVNLLLNNLGLKTDIFGPHSPMVDKPVHESIIKGIFKQGLLEKVLELLSENKDELESKLNGLKFLENYSYSEHELLSVFQNYALENEYMENLNKYWGSLEVKIDSEGNNSLVFKQGDENIASFDSNNLDENKTFMVIMNMIKLEYTINDRLITEYLYISN